MEMAVMDIRSFALSADAAHIVASAIISGMHISAPIKIESTIDTPNRTAIRKE